MGRGGSRGGVQGVRTPPPEMTCGFLIQLVFCQTMWFIGVEVEQEKSAPPPKKKTWIRPCDGGDEYDVDIELVYQTQ